MYDRQLAIAFLLGGVVWCGLWWSVWPDVDLLLPVRQPLHFLLVVIGYPVLEEIVFRGGLQGFLLRYPQGQRRWCGITGANVVTSVVFAAMHIFGHALTWAASTLLPSLVFGYFRDRNGSLWASITLHIYYNAGYFLIFGF